MTRAGGQGNDRRTPVRTHSRRTGYLSGTRRPGVSFPRLPHAPPRLNDLLARLSELSVPVIGACFAAHLVGFWVLLVWSGTGMKRLATTLDAFTRGLRHRSVVGEPRGLPDQIHAFLADVGDALAAPKHDPAAAADRAALRERIETLDESRRYLPSLSFEAAANTARTMIEAYPLLGVLGTILAIGAALGGGEDGGGAGGATVADIVGRFGEAIGSTAAGLAAALVLMLVGSLVEARFTRLIELRKDVRAAVAHAKRELIVGGAPPDGDGEPGDAS